MGQLPKLIVSALVAACVAGCPDPRSDIGDDAGPGATDATPAAMDAAAGPMDALASMDAAPQPDAGRVIAIRTPMLLPALGEATSPDGTRTVRARIASPVSHGEAASPNYKVRGGISGVGR